MGWNREQCQQPPLTEQALAYRERLKALGPYLVMPYYFYKLMSHDEVHVLAYLWNLLDMVEANKEVQQGGWFYCTTDKMQEHLQYNRTAQYRILKRLEKRGYVQTEVRQGHLCRWVRINRRRVMAEAEALAGVTLQNGT